MRSAGNFHPEWGYLAPAPSFMRTARIALVATAIGATAGAVVVVSLVARPGDDADNTSIAAHALVTSAPIVTSPVVAASPAKPPAAIAVAPSPAKAPPAIAVASKPTQAQQAVASAQPPVPATAPAPSPAASASKPNTAPPPPAPANVAALAETPSAVEAAPAPAHPETAVEPEAAPAKKAVTKKRRNASYEATRRWQGADNAKKQWRDNRGFGPLFRLFSFRTGSSAYPN